MNGTEASVRIQNLLGPKIRKLDGQEADLTEIKKRLLMLVQACSLVWLNLFSRAELLAYLNHCLYEPTEFLTWAKRVLKAFLIVAMMPALMGLVVVKVVLIDRLFG